MGPMDDEGSHLMVRSCNCCLVIIVCWHYVDHTTHLNRLPAQRLSQLKLSHEHSGFRFVKVPAISAELLQKHSGGHGSRALLMAMGIEAEANEDLDASLDRSAPPQDLLVRPKREAGFFECCFGFCLPRDDSRS
jgi:hypothetical protein